MRVPLEEIISELEKMLTHPEASELYNKQIQRIVDKLKNNQYPDIGQIPSQDLLDDLHSAGFTDLAQKLKNERRIWRI